MTKIEIMVYTNGLLVETCVLKILLQKNERI